MIDLTLSALSGKYLHPAFDGERPLRRMIPTLESNRVIERSDHHRDEVYRIKDPETLARWVLLWARRRNLGITPERHLQLLEQD